MSCSPWCTRLSRPPRAAHSPALIADAKEYRVHVLTTGLVFSALLAQWVAFPLDRVVALIIVAAIVKTGWDVLYDAVRVLLDASLDSETMEQIREIVRADPAVGEVEWLTGRNAGRSRFVEAGLTLRIGDLARAHVATRRIEAAVRKAVPRIERILIHAEPAAATHVRYAVPLHDPMGKISQHFGEAPYFALVSVRRDGGKVQEQRVLANPHHQEPKKKGLRVAEWLMAHKVDIVLLRGSLHGKGPAYVLGDAGVEWRQIDAETLEEALAAHAPGFSRSGRDETKQ